MDTKKDDLHYLLKYIRVIYYRIFHWFLRHLFKTYRLIEDCARCEDCGRNVHDFSIPDAVWIRIYGSESGILCYDCFCDRYDRKFGVKWRMKIAEFAPL